jgi:hypothetical protein
MFLILREYNLEDSNNVQRVKVTAERTFLWHLQGYLERISWTAELRMGGQIGDILVSLVLVNPGINFH